MLNGISHPEKHGPLAIKKRKTWAQNSPKVAKSEGKVQFFTPQTGRFWQIWFALISPFLFSK
jgi:hypothetical protein